jgi:hypothetical protein
LIDDVDHPWAERYTDALELFLFHYHTFSGVVRLSQDRVYNAATPLPSASKMQPGAALSPCIFIPMLEHWTICTGLHRADFEQNFT